MEGALTLFRKEVVLAKRPKLMGSVIIAQPLSTFLVTACIGLFFILGIFVVTTTEYARTEQAIGFLRPLNGVIKVFPRRPGIVTELFIHEGMYVSIGDSIAKVSVEENSFNNRSSEEQSIEYLNEKLKLLEVKKSLLESKTSIDSTKINSEKNNLKLSLAGLARRVKQQQEIVLLASSSYERSKELIASGQISRATFEDRARSKLSAEQTLEMLKQSHNDINSQIKLTPQQFLTNKLEQDLEINQLSSQILDIKQSIVELNGRRKYTLKAPVSGRATSVLTSIGREVSQQRPIATIIPLEETLVAELYVSSRAAAIIKVGQNVRLSFEALSNQELGYVPATITLITNTILTPNEIDPTIQYDRPAYKIVAELDMKNISKRLSNINLRPGMEVNAQIILEELRLIDHFLTPIKAWGETL